LSANNSRRIFPFKTLLPAFFTAFPKNSTNKRKKAPKGLFVIIHNNPVGAFKKLQKH